MDLALALGMDEEAMSQKSERWFLGWMRYAEQKWLPQYRVEAYLAQIASVIAQSVGNPDARIKDFLLDFTPKKSRAESATDSAYALANLAQGPGVRKLGQGRKKK